MVFFHSLCCYQYLTVALSVNTDGYELRDVVYFSSPPISIIRRPHKDTDIHRRDVAYGCVLQVCRVHSLDDSVRAELRTSGD